MCKQNILRQGWKKINKVKKNFNLNLELKFENQVYV